MKIHPLITESKPLAELCKRLAKAEFVCVDTEFMRESTFWPELCLIQIADSNEAAAIDPLAAGLDMTPLLDLLTKNEDVLKVFHAGGQDNQEGCQHHDAQHFSNHRGVFCFRVNGMTRRHDLRHFMHG